MFSHFVDEQCLEIQKICLLDHTISMIYNYVLVSLHIDTPLYNTVFN